MKNKIFNIFGNFRAKSKEDEVPVPSGNEAPAADLTALIKEERRAVYEMLRLKNSIGVPTVSKKVDTLIDLVQKIFKDAQTDPKDIPQIEKFAAFYLPTTIGILNQYDRTKAVDSSAESLKKLEEMLDSAVEAYTKQFDALFANDHFDIDTDITVLKGMLKSEGLDRDF